MSQYPTSPYTTPDVYPAGYGFDPMGAYLAPARRAGMLLIILGSLIVIYSLCNTIGMLVVPAEQWIAQNQRLGLQGDLPFETVKAAGLVFSILAGIFGIVMGALGFSVRRGSLAAHVIALVLDSIVVLVMGFFVLISLLAAFQAPVMLAVTFIAGIVLAAFVLLAVWLIQGMRACANTKSMQMQYQMQYWQYMQQQQMYMQQAGHGYAQAPQASNPAGGTSDGASTQG